MTSSSDYDTYKKFVEALLDEETAESAARPTTPNKRAASETHFLPVLFFSRFT